jgi:hypothetical protein
MCGFANGDAFGALARFPPQRNSRSFGAAAASLFFLVCIAFRNSLRCTQIGKIVGEGTFGKVHLGTNIFTQEKVRKKIFFGK